MLDETASAAGTIALVEDDATTGDELAAEPPALRSANVVDAEIAAEPPDLTASDAADDDVAASALLDDAVAEQDEDEIRRR